MKKSKRDKKVKSQPKKRRRLTALAVIAAAVLVIILTPLFLNLHVIRKSEPLIVSFDECGTAGDADCILVLGCGVHADGSLSDMLEDRVRTAVSLYQSGASPKLLMSGDHGRENYDEVNAMKNFAISLGVPDEDIFMDHAGFSTYESIYRAKAVFGAEKPIIVTQQYHLYRALYIASSFGLDAHGVSADLREYGGQGMRDVREVFGRCKDVLSCIFKPSPTYLGDAIPVSGNGNITNG